MLHADGSTDAAASNARRTAATDPSKSRAAPKQPEREPLKPVPDTAVSAVGETLREHGVAAPASGGGMTCLQAKTVNEVLKAQERKLRHAVLPLVRYFNSLRRVVIAAALAGIAVAIYTPTDDWNAGRR